MVLNLVLDCCYFFTVSHCCRLSERFKEAKCFNCMQSFVLKGYNLMCLWCLIFSSHLIDP